MSRRSGNGLIRSDSLNMQIDAPTADVLNSLPPTPTPAYEDSYLSINGVLGSHEGEPVPQFCQDFLLDDVNDAQPLSIVKQEPAPTSQCIPVELKDEPGEPQIKVENESKYKKARLEEPEVTEMSHEELMQEVLSLRLQLKLQREVCTFVCMINSQYKSPFTTLVHDTNRHN